MLFTLSKIVEDLNKEIKRLEYGKNPPELYEPISYMMDLGGKRLRPVLCVLAYHLFNDDFRKCFSEALSVEIFHNFTLMHDDIMDQAPLRRGKQTVHEKWNASVSILSGDVMLVKAYEQLKNVEADIYKEVISRFSKIATEVCEGQQLDMNFESRGEVAESEYLEMIRLKTAVLLGFSLELGGILSKTSNANLKNLYHFGEEIGIAFQLKDDLLDVYAEKEKFGKQVGGDIVSNKKTFLLIKAFELADKKQTTILNDWTSKKDFDKEQKVKEVTAVYDQLKLAELTEVKINEHFTAGLKYLQKVDAPLIRKKYLQDFAHGLMNRIS